MEQGQFFSGEQGNKGLKIRGTGEHRQFWGTGKIENHFFFCFVFGEQDHFFEGNKGTGTSPHTHARWEGLTTALSHLVSGYCTGRGNKCRKS